MDERSHLQLAVHAHDVVRGCAIGAETDNDTSALEILDAADAAGELEIADRIVRSGDAVTRVDRDVLICEPDTVGSEGWHIEHAEAFQPGCRRHAIFSLDEIEFALRFRDVDVHAGVTLACVCRHFLDVFARTGVRRVRSVPNADAILFGAVPARIGGVVFCDAAPLGIVHADAAAGDDRAHAAIDDGLCNGVAVVVHFHEAGCAAGDHFQHAEAGAPVHIVVRKTRLCRPDIVVEPDIQRLVAAVIAQERHRHMGVGIDVAWRQQIMLAAGKFHGVRRFLCADATDSGDAPVCDEQIADDWRKCVAFKHCDIAEQGFIHRLLPPLPFLLRRQLFPTGRRRQNRGTALRQRCVD